MSFEDERPEAEADHNANFQFFLDLAKPLVFQLRPSKDISLAAAWVKRLEEEPQTDDEIRLRVDYLKLLLFVMQRGRLIGLFKNEPPSDALQPFPQGFGLMEMGNLLLEQAELQGKGDASVAGISYSVEISNDLKEFVAAQEIPDFGVQVYYAWSMEEPIHKWSSFDENKFPNYVREKIRQLKVINSEEKTHVDASSPGGALARKSCEPSIYDKSKAKVKSPQEIERSLERSYHAIGSASVQGSPKDEERGWSCGKKSRPSSKKSTPDGSPRKSEIDMARICNQGFQDSEEDGCGSGGGMRDRGGCECGHHNRKQKPETSKRLQKCENAGENGRAFTSEKAVTAQRSTDRRGKEMYGENPRCGGETIVKDKPICPALRLLQVNPEHQEMFMPMLKTRKTKSIPQGNRQQGAVKDPCWQQSRQSGKTVTTGNPSGPTFENYSEDVPRKYGCSNPKSCNVAASSRQTCSCTCPRDDKQTRETPCTKKKPLSEKSCARHGQSYFGDNHSPSAIPDILGDRSPGNMQRATTPPVSMPPEGINHIEGCTCLGQPQTRRLEGLSRIGLGKTTPDNCGAAVKPPQQQQPCGTGRRKGGERQQKRQPSPCQAPINQQEEAMPASCLKTRMKNIGDQPCEANKKVHSCPPAKSKSSNVNSTCYQMTKPGTEDNRFPPRPTQSEYGAGSCDVKITDGDLGTCASQAKRYQTDVKNLPHSPRQQQQQQECGAEGTAKDNPMKGIFDIMMSPCSPREFVDALSNSSTDEPCPGGEDGVDGQDEAGNSRNAEKYNCAADDNDDDDDAGACPGGYSSSSENAVSGSVGQNFDDYEANECQKGPSRRILPSGQPHPMPCNAGHAPGPTPYNSPPSTSNQTGETYGIDYGGGNVPYQVPYNSPNYNQPGIPFSMAFGGGNQPGQVPFNAPQMGYNQPNPAQFSMNYAAGGQPCPGSYNPPQATYSQMQQFPLPCGAPNQNANQFSQTSTVYHPLPAFVHPNAFMAPSRQRQTLDSRNTEGNRRTMTIESSEYMPSSFLEHCSLPMTSTPRNSIEPPAPPHFVLSPIPHPPAQPQWPRMSRGMTGQMSQPASEGRTRCGGESADNEVSSRNEETVDLREWMTMRGFRRPTETSTLPSEPSSDMRRRSDVSVSKSTNPNYSMACSFGSYQEPVWRELPRARYQKKQQDSSLY